MLRQGGPLGLCSERHTSPIRARAPWRDSACTRGPRHAQAGRECTGAARPDFGRRASVRRAGLIRADGRAVKAVRSLARRGRAFPANRRARWRQSGVVSGRRAALGAQRMRYDDSDDGAAVEVGARDQVTSPRLASRYVARYRRAYTYTRTYACGRARARAGVASTRRFVGSRERARRLHAGGQHRSKMRYRRCKRVIVVRVPSCRKTAGGANAAALRARAKTCARRNDSRAASDAAPASALSA